MAITNQELVKANKSGTVVTSLGEFQAGDAITLKGDGSSDTGQITLNNAGNTAGTILKSGAVSSSITFTLPSADGSDGHFLKTNGAGVLSFVADSAPTNLDSKTLTTATTVTGTLNLTGAAITGASPLVFEGATDNDFETTFAITDATADRTITFPDAAGTVALTSDLSTFITASSTDTLTNKTLTAPVITSVTSGGNAITFPNTTAQTLAGLAETQKFTKSNLGNVTAANTSPINMSLGNNFTITPSTTQSLSFKRDGTNNPNTSTEGQAGNIYVDTSTAAMSIDTNTVLISTADSTKLGTTGKKYWVSFFHASGTKVLVAVSGELA